MFLLMLPLMMTSQVYSVPNLALYRPGSQSSLYGDQMTMEKALDGNYGSDYDQLQCVVTGYNDTFSWAQVDLELFYSIHTVWILNRGKRFGDRLANITVDVYEEDRSEFPSAISKSCARYPGTVAIGQWVELACDSHVTGRYVRVSKMLRYESDLLHFCELEVYGERVKGRGLAFQRTADSKILNQVLSEHTLPTFTRCLHLCYKESLCYSVNFKQSTVDGTPNCQLVYISLDNPIQHDESGWNKFSIDTVGSRKLPFCGN